MRENLAKIDWNNTLKNKTSNRMLEYQVQANDVEDI